MNMKASSLFQTKQVDRPLLGPKGKSEVSDVSCLPHIVCMHDVQRSETWRSCGLAEAHCFDALSVCVPTLT